MSSEPAQPGDRPSITERLMFAVPAALFYGTILYFLIWMPSGESLPFMSGLVLFPMAITGTATILADPRGEGSLWRHIKIGWICITLFIVLSMVLMREAGICVVMAAPFFYAGSALGSLISRLSLRKLRSRSIASCLVILPLVGLPAEPLVPAPEREGQVQTVIDIDAPPEIVWKNTVEIPDVSSRELQWTFSHNVVGVPKPVDARLEGQGIGAIRHLRWTRGVTFEEIVTDWQPDRYLSWNFRFGPHSIPEAVEGHIKVDSSYLKLAGGDYRLDPLPNGGTRLTLTTRYVIATPINSYCDWWGRIFLNDFHGTVLNVIRHRAEAQAKGSGAAASAPNLIHDPVADSPTGQPAAM